MVNTFSNGRTNESPHPVRSMEPLEALSDQAERTGCLSVASNRARSTGKRHRLVDDNGNLLDLIDLMPAGVLAGATSSSRHPVSCG